MSRVFFWNQSIIVLFFLILISIGIPVCSGASGSWYIQTVDKGKVGNGTSLAMDSGGFAHISYIDFGNESLKYVRQDGSGWHATTVDTHVVGLTKTSLALDSDGNPYISYYDGRNGALKFAELRSPQWQITVVDKSDIDINRTGNSTSLALDRAGNPHISYTDYKTGALKYATRNATGWSTVVVDPAGGVTSSIMLDRKGSPHIAYVDFKKRFLKYAYKTGSAWNLSTVDPYGGHESSLALDSHDRPHIAYVNFSSWSLKYARQDEFGWHIQIIDPDSSSGWSSSIRLDENDTPFVAYRRDAPCFSYSNCEEGGLRLARHDAEGWNITSVDRWGGYAASLALDREGNPHISYFDIIAGAVKYVRARAPTDPLPTTVTPVPTPSIPAEPPETSSASNPETDRVIYDSLVFIGLVAVIFGIFCIVTFWFSKNPEKTTYQKKDLNVLIFPDETKIFFVLVILLSLGGFLRMLLFFPDLFSEFSRSAFATYIYIERDFSFLILIPFIILAFLVYILRPGYLIRNVRMIRMEEKEPTIAEKITDLAGRLKLATPITAMFSPDNGITIYTFGTHLQYYIVMNRGFIDVFHDHADEFRAILCHELSHIRSGDVKRTELALAFLTSFFCFAVIFIVMGITVITINFSRYGANLGPTTTSSMSAVLTHGNPTLQNFIINFSSSIVVVVIVGVSIWFLVRFIIQYRELYADWMTTQMMGESVSLERALTRMQAVAQFQAGARLREKRHGFFPHLNSFIVPRYHPPIQDREEFLDNPGRFFSSWLALPFIVGFAGAWFCQMAVIFLAVFQITIDPDSLLVPVFIPGVFLSAALLLPRLTLQTFLPQDQRSWHSNPVVVSQVFMLGYASAFYIIINISLVLDQVIHQVLLIGSPVTYNGLYSIYGMKFPAYHPAYALIESEFVAVSVLGILLISLIFTHLLVQFTAVQWMFRRPVLSLLILPAFFASVIILIALTGSPLLVLVLLFFCLLVLILSRQKFQKCPVCASPLPGSFDPGISCPECGFDYGWWIKNAK